MKAVLIPGDGIGPEISASVESITKAMNLDIEWVKYRAGAEYAKETGEVWEPGLVDAIEEYKWALKGPTATPIGTGFRSVNVALRQKFSTYANVRPLRNFKGIDSKYENIDFSNIDSVVTDQEDIYKELIEEFNGTDFAKKIKRYDDSAISLNLLYKLSSQIKELCSSQVWLNSGANIIIEQLETLSVIDVNSSKCATKRDSDILKINMEAATEAARQIRLRNISGMIIIDFINMKSKEDESALINHLKSELKKDSITCSFIDITKLSLIEITRKKEYKSLKETIIPIH